jgi:hypothetical protein
MYNHTLELMKYDDDKETSLHYMKKLSSIFKIPGSNHSTNFFICKMMINFYYI